jgi:collagenase-like protein with putative collagen-binding domain
MPFNRGDTGMNPIALHPDNPHYFLFRGKPTILITSAEHYGAVLNGDFNYIPYLDELHGRGFNLTRVFTGAYCEDPASFGIENNTLAPAPGRLICPWKRSAAGGYPGGGAKFDLHAWDEAYFRRLRDLCQQASERGIVVEVVMFCPYYKDEMWELSPLKASNNINGDGDVPREEVLTLSHPGLVAVQEAMVRKIVSELKGYDNLYYEVCNEPYFGGVNIEWQNRIIATIAGAEAALPTRHLIAQNISNGSCKIPDPNPAVSIFNFHYSNPPDSVALNADLHRVIAFDESGFRGTADLPYRTEAWEFILAGGAVYDHLDYSFTTAHPEGTFHFTTSPGGGGPTLRRQLQILKQFIESFDFIPMAPDNSVIKGSPPGATARALAETGKAYAVYLKEGSQGDLTLEIPPGRYRAEWLNPRTGEIDRREDVVHEGHSLTLASPDYSEDTALRLVRSGR